MFKRIAILSGLLCLSAALAGAGEARNGLGWYGEPLPQGLEKASKEGEYIWEKDGSVMVYVPAGWFPMGSEDITQNEKPVHDVYLDAYYIDKYEVSWRQWKLSGLPYADYQFARVRYPEAPDWGILDDHPVMSVNWEFARKYVEWAGKRLPSEAEWEKAARGTDGRRFPWGDSEVTFEKALWMDHPMAKAKAAPVDCCREGASPYGALNMAGNVYEWCQDYFSADYYARSPKKNPLNQEPGKYRVLRGGAFVLEKEDLRSALRYRLREKDRAPYIGFRAVVSAPSPGR
ncbi:MAG TPA: SUMF1/EgtB/PvdO family nonheme iron enzyme [Acidobacteriota bacterium]|nr:SUMF1/EgtB/PvdO family nonheme iron enzyme [Acidobacteriota bacterium]